MCRVCDAIAPAPPNLSDLEGDNRRVTANDFHPLGQHALLAERSQKSSVSEPGVSHDAQRTKAIPEGAGKRIRAERAGTAPTKPAEARLEYDDEHYSFQLTVRRPCAGADFEPARQSRNEQLVWMSAGNNLPTYTEVLFFALQIVQRAETAAEAKVWAQEVLRFSGGSTEADVWPPPGATEWQGKGPKPAPLYARMEKAYKSV